MSLVEVEDALKADKLACRRVAMVFVAGGSEGACGACAVYVLDDGMMIDFELYVARLGPSSLGSRPSQSLWQGVGVCGSCE